MFGPHTHTCIHMHLYEYRYEYMNILYEGFKYNANDKTNERTYMFL